MKRQPNTNPNRPPGSKATVQILAATFALGALLALPARAEVFVPDATKPGGLQIYPTIGTPVPGSNNTATLPIHGLQAPYMIQTSPNGVDWQNSGVTALQYPNHSGTCLATNVPAGVAQFRLMMLGSENWVGKYNPGALAISNAFSGYAKCVGCHSDKISDWSGTHHATALNELMDSNGNFIGHAGPSCVPCHTVGNGQPGGFVSLATTPQLANVQCENCHGSADAHINISGRTYRPVNTLAAETCGSCHSGSHHPTFEEWSSSGHAEVVPDVGYGVAAGVPVYTNDLTVGTTVWHGYSVDPTTGKTNALSGMVNSTDDNAGNGRQMGCGFCHSGATRVAMLSDWEARKRGTTNFLTLPDKWDAAEVAQSCAVCHDPHSAAITNQLRNPLYSTSYYTMFTGVQPTITNTFVDRFGATNLSFSYLNGGFASQYDPNIQVCAQCHNSRGARWDGRSKSWNAASNAMVLGTSQSFTRGPHHSPQYNILTGIVQDDYLNGTNAISHPHRTIATQCAACHVPNYAVNSSTNVSGHSFALDVKGCALAGCHTSYTDDGLHAKVEDRQTKTKASIAQVVSLLNQWATTMGPTVFGASYSKYLQNGWEYTTIGALATITNAGPSGADALKVPDVIKQARFNVYMVQNDASFMHNPSYIDYLLNVAKTNITSQFANANFRANAVVGYTNFTVTFTNLGTGPSIGWNFGDGGTATGPNPSYTYTTPGIYDVTCTNGTEVMTRTAYIQAVVKPTVSFVPNAATVPVNTPVTFTNTSANISDCTAWRFQANTAISASRVDSGFVPTYTYTYTNTGTFSVTLRASTPAGTITTTNSIIVTP